MHVQSLGQKDPLEKNMATNCSIFDWKFPWTVEPGSLQSMSCRVRRTEWLGTHATQNAFVTFWPLNFVFQSFTMFCIN